MCDSPDIMFSQYGQGFPIPSLSWHIPEQHRPEPAIKKSRTRREGLKRKASEERPLCQSYVLNNEKKKGLRLIQIQVLDISERQEKVVNPRVGASSRVTPVGAWGAFCRPFSMTILSRNAVIKLIYFFSILMKYQ
ncbi:hypothetical protein PYW07_013502 [Mythimna separata]|uniref:Uncharacterized protein n=1 Tax=Mythimna separata TaxID=271217 RepID=A0AAD7YB20_MYTSE|nr:hypothetical protein PYW07_013502 [Mythimna separata]